MGVEGHILHLQCQLVSICYVRFYGIKNCSVLTLSQGSDPHARGIHLTAATIQLLGYQLQTIPQVGT